MHTHITYIHTMSYTHTHHSSQMHCGECPSTFWAAWFMVDMSLLPQVTHIHTYTHTHTHIHTHSDSQTHTHTLEHTDSHTNACTNTTVLGNCKQGTNVTIHVMYLNLLRIHKEGEDIPDSCYLQLDNTAKQCKSRYHATQN